MTTSDETSDADSRKNAILLKVGRNVANLQQLEVRFKALQSIHLNAPMTKITDAIRKHKEAIARQTLGPLTHETVDKLFPEQSPQAQFDDLTTEAWITSTLAFEGNEALKRNMRTQLKRLVDDRNQLIHHMFGGFDPRSAESCSALELKLDAQRTHIAEVFRWVDEIIDLMRQYIAELKKKEQELRARNGNET